MGQGSQDPWIQLQKIILHWIRLDLYQLYGQGLSQRTDRSWLEMRLPWILIPWQVQACPQISQTIDWRI